MDDETQRHANRVVAGQEWYEDLQHVFAAHRYTKAVLLDARNALDGVYKIERWTADGMPTMLVTIGDDGLIELWASPGLWGEGTPGDGGNVVNRLNDLLTARRRPA